MQELIAALSLVLSLATGTVQGGMDIAQPYGASYAKTMDITGFSNHVVETYYSDLSELRVACIGDSLTSGVGQGNYPDMMKPMLGTEHIYNCGVGGSSICGVGHAPMSNRYWEIPEDTDVIVVCGGLNDSFEVTEEKFGEVGTINTFCGDVDRLLKGLQDGYPDAKIFFYIPPPSYEFDSLKAKNPALLTQERFRAEILRQCKSLGIDVIDAYSLNFLNPFDEQVRMSLYRDHTHPNGTGLQLMACFIAARIVLWAQETGFSS